ncbi:MAG: signal peptidase I [Lachnospiraceae bacterium]|nr:signal peptidase I [Lachnospiraceae bacterium]
MAILRKKGLSFRRRKKKASLSISKNIALFIVKILITLFIAFIVVYTVGMKVTVSGNSMESTVSDSDRVLVNRLIYSLSDPKSGDVIVFLPNGNEKSHYYVKRVVAVPGDTVLIRDGVLYINGAMYDEEDTEAIVSAGLAEEEITVGDDEYFVLGDNRNSSEDSRYANIGNVKKEYIVGKAWFYFGSIRNMGRIQ